MQQRSGDNKRVVPVSNVLPKKQQHLPNENKVQLNNQLPVDTRHRIITNEINPPEILATQDTQLRRKKQQRDRSKENRTIVLSGNVDLGENVFKTSKRLRNRKRPNLKSVNYTTASTSAHDPSSASNNDKVNERKAPQPFVYTTSLQHTTDKSYQSTSSPSMSSNFTASRQIEKVFICANECVKFFTALYTI